jgi:SAM-dependent methyltransferase
MNAPDPGAPNQEQIHYWNEIAGPRWCALQEIMDPLLRSAGVAGMDAVGVGAGERALDVGCGCGDTSLELARRVGLRGRVVGIDVSGPMLERARSRAKSVPNLEFVQEDAQTSDLGEGSFDLAYSRFGTMFFADPEGAFANLHRALQPEGRLGFVCWQAVQLNPFMYEPVAAAATVIPLPPRPPPGTPGPFALADPERLTRILERAGFRSVKLEDWQGEIEIGARATALNFFCEVGPLSAALREADAGPDLREKVVQAIGEMLSGYETPDGIRMPVALWLVTARKT